MLAGGTRLGLLRVRCATAVACRGWEAQFRSRGKDLVNHPVRVDG